MVKFSFLLRISLPTLLVSLGPAPDKTKMLISGKLGSINKQKWFLIPYEECVCFSRNQESFLISKKWLVSLRANVDWTFHIKVSIINVSHILKPKQVHVQTHAGIICLECWRNWLGMTSKIYVSIKWGGRGEDLLYEVIT